MEKNVVEEVSQFVSPEERVQLVRLCAVLVGDREVAEDLAQETLIEAWRHKHALRDQTRRTSWLSGIAHNVCLRWLRDRRRDTAHLITSQHAQDAQLADLEDALEMNLISKSSWNAKNSLNCSTVLWHSYQQRHGSSSSSAMSRSLPLQRLQPSLAQTPMLLPYACNEAGWPFAAY